MKIAENLHVTLRNWRTFAGRASRAEFFGFVYIVIGVMSLAITSDRVLIWAGFFPCLSIIAGVLLFIPLLSLTVRRFQDIDCAAPFAILGLLIFPPAVLVYAMMPGTYGANRFGPNPLGRDFPKRIQIMPSNMWAPSA